MADELCDKMNRLLGRLQPEAAKEAEPEATLPEQPATPEDKVELLLNQLFADHAEDVPAPAQKSTVSLSDVLPAYCK